MKNTLSGGKDILIEARIKLTDDISIHQLCTLITDGYVFDNLQKTLNCRVEIIDVSQSLIQIEFNRSLFGECSWFNAWKQIWKKLLVQDFIQGFTCTQLELSPSWLDSISHPLDPIEFLRNSLKTTNRPLLASTILQNDSMSSEMFLADCYQLWSGGVDIIFYDTPYFLELPVYRNLLQTLHEEKIQVEQRVKQNVLFVPKINFSSLSFVQQQVKLFKQEGCSLVSFNPLGLSIADWSILSYLCHQNQMLLAVHLPHKELITLTQWLKVSTSVLKRLFLYSGIDIISCEKDTSFHGEALFTSLHQDLPQPWLMLHDQSNIFQFGELIDQYGTDWVLLADESIKKHPDGKSSGAKACKLLLEGLSKRSALQTIRYQNESVDRALRSYYYTSI